MTEKDIIKLSSFHTKNLRRIIRFFWPQTISNQDLFDEYQQESIETTIARRRWRWIGHISLITQRSKLHPKSSSRMETRGTQKTRASKDDMEAKATAIGHSWGTLRTLAQDRLRWREFVAAQVVYDKRGSN